MSAALNGLVLYKFYDKETTIRLMSFFSSYYIFGIFIYVVIDILVNEDGKNI